jgi:hypothetical protein
MTTEGTWRSYACWAHGPQQSSLLRAELSDSAAAPSTLFRVSGRRVKANLAKHALCWQFDSRICLPRQHQAVNTGASVCMHRKHTC